MAHDVQRPHDKLFRTVFADHGEAAALLRAHLPESLARDLRWSTLTLQDRSFVDPDLRDTESDLLFSIRRKAGAPPAWLYVLVEGQVGTIESLLQAGVQWSVIEEATGIDRDALGALKQRLQESEKPTDSG